MSKEKVAETKINLFKEFPSTDAEEWKKQIEKDLPGVNYDEKLVWKTYEGFNVEPFYTEKDLEEFSYLTDSLPGQFPFVRGSVKRGNEWEICEEISGHNINDSNKLAKEALNNGADSITFEGVSVDTADEFSELLKDIPLDEIKLNFNIDLDKLEIFNLLVADARKRGFEPSKLSGAFYLSPLNYLLSNGSNAFDSGQPFQKIKDFIAEVELQTPDYKLIAVNSEVFSDAGSNIVQELAFSLAMGCEYIVRLMDMGLDTDLISKKIVFQFPVSPDYFMEIAKLRAARLLWAKIVEKFNPTDESSFKMTIHCKTTESKGEDYDPYLKMLADTIEAMAAIIGGCDTLTVLAYERNNKSGKEYLDRLPRNTQLVLKEEAYLQKIKDPGSGSYYIEKLTDILASEALKLFQNIEKNGGFIQCVENSFIIDQINDVRNSRKNPE